MVFGTGLAAVLVLPVVSVQDVVAELPAQQGAALVFNASDVRVLHQLGVEA